MSRTHFQSESTLYICLNVKELHARKGSTKRLKHAGNLFRKNLQLKDINSRLKATKIIGQRKAFYRQRIPESSCTRKETVDIDNWTQTHNHLVHKQTLNHLAKLAK